MLKMLQLPKRQQPKGAISILEGESLLNDAAGIISFKIAVAALVTGAFSAFDAIERSMASNAENAPVTKAATAILKDMIPAASFSKDSPSKIEMAPLGCCRFGNWSIFSI